jgi:hypothetical protein
LSPLKFTDDEWNESLGGIKNTFQNNRNPAVFKEEKDGRPYYIDSYEMEKKPGNCWTGSLLVEGNRRVKYCYIIDASEMPKITIYPQVEYHSEYSDDWDFLPVPESSLDELKKYYDVELG